MDQRYNFYLYVMEQSCNFCKQPVVGKLCKNLLHFVVDYILRAEITLLPNEIVNLGNNILVLTWLCFINK